MSKPCSAVPAIFDKPGKLKRCQDIIKYQFRDEDLLWEALQQPAAYSGMYLPEGNKTLAHLGDGVLLLYIRREAWKRGVLRGKAHNLGELVKTNAKMNELGRQLGIDKCINLGNSTGGVIQENGKVIADATEAIIGAAYLDSGEDFRITGAVIEALGLKIPDETPAELVAKE